MEGYTASPVADIRNLLEKLVAPWFLVTDSGYDYTNKTADLVLQRDGERYEITIRKLEK